MKNESTADQFLTSIMESETDLLETVKESVLPMIGNIPVDDPPYPYPSGH